MKSSVIASKSKKSLPLNPNQEKYALLLKTLLVYTLLVILWGAWVRISHSGDGCGESWPLCNGSFIPGEVPKKTWVEYAHRLQSGLFGVFVAAAALAAYRLFEKGHPVRRYALASVFFTITEALLGAKLVLSGLVAQNDSLARALAMALHFLNSAFLVANLTLLALFAARAQWTLRREEDQIISMRMRRRLPVVAGLIFLILGATGSVAALSTTLFPSSSLLEGLRADFDPNSHFLLRLRTLHPTMGVFAGTGLVLLFYFAGELAAKHEEIFRRRTWFVIGVIATTVIVGSVTLLALSPVPLKLLHLGLAHSLVIGLTAWWQSLRYQMNTKS